MSTRRFCLGVLAALVVAAVGCSKEDLPLRETRVGPNAVYVNYQLRKTYSKPIDETFSAALAGLKALEIVIVEQKHDKLRGDIKAVLADGTNVDLKLKSVDKGTYMTIQAGLLGDKNISVNVMRAIDRQLGVSSTEPAVAVEVPAPKSTTEKAADDAAKAQKDLTKQTEVAKPQAPAVPVAPVAPAAPAAPTPKK